MRNLKKMISDSKKSLVDISNESGVSRKTIYNIINDIKVKDSTSDKLYYYLKNIKFTKNPNIELNQTHYNDLISLQKEKIKTQEDQIKFMDKRLEQSKKTSFLDSYDKENEYIIKTKLSYKPPFSLAHVTLDVTNIEVLSLALAMDMDDLMSYMDIGVTHHAQDHPYFKLMHTKNAKTKITDLIYGICNMFKMITGDLKFNLETSLKNPKNKNIKVNLKVTSTIHVPSFITESKVTIVS